MRSEFYKKLEKGKFEPNIAPKYIPQYILNYMQKQEQEIQKLQKKLQELQKLANKRAENIFKLHEAIHQLKRVNRVNSDLKEFIKTYCEYNVPKYWVSVTVADCDQARAKKLKEFYKICKKKGWIGRYINVIKAKFDYSDKYHDWIQSLAWECEIPPHIHQLAIAYSFLQNPNGVPGSLLY